MGMEAPLPVCERSGLDVKSVENGTWGTGNTWGSAHGQGAPQRSLHLSTPLLAPSLGMFKVGRVSGTWRVEQVGVVREKSEPTVSPR